MRVPFSALRRSPLQLVDLFLLVVLLVLHLPEDLQEPLHLGLSLVGVLFVTAHFLLQAADALREFGAGCRLGGRALSLRPKDNYRKSTGGDEWWQLWKREVE